MKSYNKMQFKIHTIGQTETLNKLDKFGFIIPLVLHKQTTLLSPRWDLKGLSSVSILLVRKN